MGFNKRYFSKESLKLKANNSSNYKEFLNYFKVDGAIFEDQFSSSIFEEIKKFSIENEKEINEIITKCKNIL